MCEQRKHGSVGAGAGNRPGYPTAAGGSTAPERAPDPELAERPKRRRFSAEYKLQILKEADACAKQGELGALLRREGLYSSHLSTWRPARGRRAEGASAAAGAKAGRPACGRERRAAPPRRARRDRAGQGAQGDRGAGKRLSALGGPTRDRERRREHRAMICQTVEELAPIVGTRPACRALGASPATIYRRRRPPEPRPKRPRPKPARSLSEAERAAVLEALRGERFLDSSPAAVWATLLDEGAYLCSERTMYRLLAQSGESRERRDQLTHPAYAKPELLAEGPNEVWSWDISKLKGPAKWTSYQLYVILDVFSRYAVGWTVQERESATVAEALIAQSCEQQSIGRDQLTVHADRGPSMRSKPVAMLLADLGVTKTHSRP